MNMACFHPLKAFQTIDGGVVFTELARYDIVRTLELPCGQCIGCRLERSRQWAMRCMHESSLYERNCFVTLTYDDEHLPVRGVLEYPTFQKFLKRLRKAAGDPGIRFYMCGEYGKEPVKPTFDLDGRLMWRPHYHACLFNWNWPDAKYWRRSESGENLYRSDMLERLWPYGQCESGSVTFESAAYVARYCVEKVTGFNADAHYMRRDAAGTYFLPPEFNKMSLKPGIGAPWLAKWEKDVYPLDYCVVNGVECRPPKYYDKLFKAKSPEVMEDLTEARIARARERAADNTLERLAVKEIVQRARVRTLYRSL